MFVPSWSNYATHDDAEYPQLWDGCVGAVCPGLGPSGDLFNLACLQGPQRIPLQVGTYADTWKMVGGQWVIDINSTTGNYFSGMMTPGPRTKKTASVVMRQAWVGTQPGSCNYGYSCSRYQTYAGFDMSFFLQENPNPATATIGFQGLYGNASAGAPGIVAGDGVFKNLAGRVFEAANFLDMFVDGRRGTSFGNYYDLTNYGDTWPWYIGRGANPAYAYFNGYIHSLYVYDRVLSVDEIRLFNENPMANFIPRTARTNRTFSFGDLTTSRRRRLLLAT